VSKARRKLTFYVDTKCSFSTQGRCSYYSSRKIQKQVGDNAKSVWGRTCCPIVYFKRGEKRFTAFCPTKGGAWGEQLPALGGPGKKAIKIELEALSDEPWQEIIEKAAKIACRTKG
jgi:hypothetical protein